MMVIISLRPYLCSFILVVSPRLQEIPENAADVAHLGHLHTPSIISGVDLRYTNSRTWEFLRHDWKVRLISPYQRGYFYSKWKTMYCFHRIHVCDCMPLFIVYVFMLFKGSVGAGAGAQPALFPDVGETRLHRVWSPLASAGRPCCGQTGGSPNNQIIDCIQTKTASNYMVEEEDKYYLYYSIVSSILKVFISSWRMFP